MARSIEDGAEAQRPARGYIPPQNDKERFLMRHIEDLARTAQARGIPRYSSFLSDREQALAQAALSKAGCSCWRLEGGYPEAERKIAAIEPEDAWTDSPLACVRLDCRAAPGADLPAHRDYLGSLMGLALKREALGDIVLPADAPGTAYVFALEPAARLICEELVQVGRTAVSCTPQSLEELPGLAPEQRVLHTAAVSSLRLDAVLAAMLHCSRGAAAALIEAGRVEINHLPTESIHAPVYEGDIFTIRGRGRFALTALPGKTRKDRQIIEFFQYQS